MKLLITGGGTGGHVSPGLAVASLWAKGNGKDQVVWAGRQGGIEERMATAQGIRFGAVEARPFKRSLDIKNLSIPWSLVKGLRQALKLLKLESPAVVLMTGGYVAVPVALAAVLLRKPLVLIEPQLCRCRRTR